MSTTITAERTSTDLPLELLVARGGGTTGLTCVVALRDGATDGDYLDFADGTFKSAGWTTRQSAMVEISATNAPGKYVLRVDLSSLTIPAATDYLVAEYAVSGTVTAVAQDVVELVASAYDLPADIDAELSGTHGAGAWTTATGFAVPGDAMDLVTDAVDASAVATTGAEEIRDSILSDSTPFAGANIDAAISSRSSHSAADVDTVLTASHGAGSWAGLATAPQVIRDAMKLAPTAGAPAAGSIDEALDTIEADTAAIEPLVSTNVDATISSRSSHSAADVDTVLSASHGAGSWVGSVAPQDIRDAMKLAPSAGAPAAGSVDDHLDTIEADTNALETRITVARAAALDEVTSARLSELDAANLPADVAAILADTTAGGPGPWTTGAGDWTAGERSEIRQALGVTGTKAPAAGGDVQDIQGRLPASLVGGRMDADVGAVQADAIAADAFADNAALRNAYALDRIWIETTGGGAPGTVVGVNGTRANPSNNLADALVLAAAVGTKTLDLCGAITLSSALENFVVVSSCKDPVTALVNINGQSIENSRFEFCTLIGTMAGKGSYLDCLLSGLVDFHGVAWRCRVGGGGLTLRDVGVTYLFDCANATANAFRVPIIFTGTGVHSLVITGWEGSLEIESMTGASQDAAITMRGPEIVVGPSNTSGAVNVSGLATLVDNSAGTTVTAALLPSSTLEAVLAPHETTTGSLAEALAVLRNRIRIDFTAGPPRELVVYDQAGTTELYRAELTTTNGAEVLAFFGVQHERGSPT